MQIHWTIDPAYMALIRRPWWDEGISFYYIPNTNSLQGYPLSDNDLEYGPRIEGNSNDIHVHL